MKGFPNQIADIKKLALAMQVLAGLVDSSEDAKNDDLFGEALLRGRVLNPGRKGLSIDQYLAIQRTKRRSNQSHQMSARGLRELFRLLGFIDDSEPVITITPDGRQVAAIAGVPVDPDQIDFWRHAIRRIHHSGRDTEASHPYQVMLKLIARRPGITRAMCALALEAKDDSDAELGRIVILAGLPEEDVIEQIGVTRSNWNNAKKVLPSFAEQLGDVVKTGQTYQLADAPGFGNGGASIEELVPTDTADSGVRPLQVPHRPRASRTVTSATIGRAGIAEQDEQPVPPDLDPAAAAEAVRRRLDRLRRHNLLVRALAARFEAAGMILHENPFDLLAVSGRVGDLLEMKTLDGTPEDERERVRDALAKLLYYEAFVTSPVVGRAAIHKIACFERPISEPHQDFLNQSNIGTIWVTESGRLAGDALAAGMLRDHFEEFR